MAGGGPQGDIPAETDVEHGHFDGRIEHLVSGQVRLFHSLEELIDFFEHLLFEHLLIERDVLVMRQLTLSEADLQRALTANLRRFLLSTCMLVEGREKEESPGLS